MSLYGDACQVVRHVLNITAYIVSLVVLCLIVLIMEEEEEMKFNNFEELEPSA